MGFWKELKAKFAKPKDNFVERDLKKFLVLLDANYVKRLQESYKNPKGVVNFPKNLLKGNRYGIGISDRILDELVRTKKGGSKGLIEMDTLVEIAKKYNIDFMHAKDISKERGEFLRKLWSRYSPKGKIDSRLQINRKKFVKSGDVELLSMAIDRRNNPTIILSDDKDIHYVGNELRKRGLARIYVYTFKEVADW
jgi:hypothetical protein